MARSSFSCSGGCPMCESRSPLIYQRTDNTAGRADRGGATKTGGRGRTDKGRTTTTGRTTERTDRGRTTTTDGRGRTDRGRTTTERTTVRTDGQGDDDDDDGTRRDTTGRTEKGYVFNMITKTLIEKWNQVSKLVASSNVCRSFCVQALVHPCSKYILPHQR